MTRSLLLVASVGCVLAGCQRADPFRDPYLYQPSGANQGNLGAMVANPHDLVWGKAEAGSDAGEAETAIQQLRAGKRPSLPTTNSFSTGGGSSGGGS